MARLGKVCLAGREVQTRASPFREPLVKRRADNGDETGTGSSRAVQRSALGASCRDAFALHRKGRRDPRAALGRAVD